MTDLTRAQADAIGRLMGELGSKSVFVDRDVPHDTHVFVTFAVLGDILHAADAMSTTTSSSHISPHNSSTPTRPRPSR